jgi:hypothetical protein
MAIVVRMIIDSAVKTITTGSRRRSKPAFRDWVGLRTGCGRMLPTRPATSSSSWTLEIAGCVPSAGTVRSWGALAETGLNASEPEVCPLWSLAHP